MPKAKQPIFALILVAMTVLSGCDSTRPDSGTSQHIITAGQNAGNGSSAIRTIGPDTVGARPTGTQIPNMSATREAIETSVETTRVARATVLALSPTISVPTYPPPTTPQPRPTGIFDGDIGAHHCDCRFENSWIGNVGGHEYQAYAGEFYWPGEDWAKPSPHGVILLFKHNPPTQWFLTPVDAGSVHIVSASGTQLTILSTNRTQFIFDAETGNWIEPPITPPVTPTGTTAIPN